jgi:hypothetical protein
MRYALTVQSIDCMGYENVSLPNLSDPNLCPWIDQHTA